MATKPMRTYPACPMDEKASIRFTFSWRKAARLPQVMVTALRMARIQGHWTCSSTWMRREPFSAPPAGESYPSLLGPELDGQVVTGRSQVRVLEGPLSTVRSFSRSFAGTLSPARPWGSEKLCGLAPSLQTRTHGDLTWGALAQRE